MKFEGNRRLALTLVMLGIILSFFGGSLAYWNWETSESQKTMVSVKVQGATLTIEGGNVTHTGMYPTKYCDGEAALIGDVATVTAVNGTESDMEAIIKIRASLSVSQGTLTSEKKSKLNWALIDTSDGTTCSNTQYKGTLADVTTSTDIDTGIRFIATAESTTTKTYRIYVWLDSTYTHTNSGSVISDPMQNLNISVRFSPASELSQESANTVSSPNAPVLDPGMIPVTIANNGTVTTVSETDSSWYNYSNKEWANAVLVNSESRSNYQGTTGKTVNQGDILAYYVWIPRYKYKMGPKCSSLNNPTMENYPSCYAPYTMSDDDKTSLIAFVQYYVINVVGISDFSISQAMELTNRALQTGYYIIGNESMTIQEAISIYNSQTGSNVTYTGTFNGANIVSVSDPWTIDITFESRTDTVAYGNAVDTYRSHPAFVWDGKTVSGIWVGKFETTGNKTTPTILPNTSPLTDQNINDQFATSLSFAGGTQSGKTVTFAGNNTYGLTSKADSHMMKNSEWGAAIYLAYSQYGIDDEISMNNSSDFINCDFITGCGASEKNSISTGECQISYGSGVSSYPQSTTGNITGIFDMYGGAEEMVMGLLASVGATSDLLFIQLPEGKYYDLYPISQFTGDIFTNISLCTLETCGGHALNETYGWYGYGDIFPMVGGDAVGSWLMRVNRFVVLSEQLQKIGFFPSLGIFNSAATFRSVLIID